MPPIHFIKASACGNDFLIVDLRHANLRPDEDELAMLGSLSDLTQRMCNRHEGVGADGVEFVFADKEADARLSLINADGSPAEISGNGTRCVAAFLVSQLGKDEVKIRTDAGVKTCSLTGRAGHRFDFEVAMGEPQLGDPFPIRLAFGEVTGTPVSMGNPHFVLFVEDFKVGWQAEAAEIGRHHDFKYGINVELVRIEAKHVIEALFFERGAGETQSSGTGSCAAAVAAIAAQRAESPVEVRTPGGVQVVRWQGEVLLRGPAQLICHGEFYL